MSRTIEKVVAEVFELDESRVSDDLTPDDVDQWDSFNHLKLVTALEKAFGIKLRMREVMSMTSVSKIKEVVREHAGDS